MPAGNRSRKLSILAAVRGITSIDAPSSSAESAGGPLQILHPSDGAEWWVDPVRPTLTELRASAPDVRWEIDGRSLPAGEASWLPVAGRHRVAAVRGGERVEVQLTVNALERAAAHP